MEIKRGDILIANLEPVVGSEQGQIRPVLVLQNNVGNLTSLTTIIAPITPKKFIKEYPTNVEIFGEDSGLDNISTVLLNQIKTIDKERVTKKIGFLGSSFMKKVDCAIRVSLDLF